MRNAGAKYAILKINLKSITGHTSDLETKNLPMLLFCAEHATNDIIRVYLQSLHVFILQRLSLL